MRPLLRGALQRLSFAMTSGGSRCREQLAGQGNNLQKRRALVEGTSRGRWAMPLNTQEGAGFLRRCTLPITILKIFNIERFLSPQKHAKSTYTEKLLL